jgi:hypothetical protein
MYEVGTMKIIEVHLKDGSIVIFNRKYIYLKQDYISIDHCKYWVVNKHTDLGYEIDDTEYVFIYKYILKTLF